MSTSSNKYSDCVQSIQRQLRFSVDEVTGRKVVKVIDAETNETIRQIPAEEIMAISRQMSDEDKVKFFTVQL